MTKNKKYILFFLAFIFIFMLQTISQASTFIDIQYDYLYEYKINAKNEDVKKLEEKVLQDDRVKSGDFYYFIAYSTGDFCYNTYLIRKKAIKDTLYIHFANWNGNGMESFFVGFSNEDLQSNGDYILYSGRNGYGYNYENSGLYSFNISANLDKDNKIYTFDFATNYEGKIVRKCSNDKEKTFFFQTTVPILEQVTELPKVIKEIITKIIPVGLVVLSIFLVIFLIRYVISRLM